MIAVDTNVLRRYFRGVIDSHTAIVAEAINSDDAFLPPIVLTEAMSNPDLHDHEFVRTCSLPLLTLFHGYWLRAGNLRRQLITDHRAAPIADCLIAQACIDAGVPLLTDDGGFTRYIEFGLKLL